MDSVDNITSDTPNIQNNGSKQLSQQKRGRGRPRKNQMMNDTDKLKKNKIISSKPLNKNNSINDEEEIILHMPISMKDMNTMKSSISSNKQDTSNDTHNTNIFTINDMNSDSESNSSNYEVNDVVVTDLKQKVREQEKIIKSLEKEVNEYKTLISDNSANGINNRKVTKMNIELINIHDGKALVTEKTDIACWWCTYNFDSMPCFIPEKYFDKKYFVFGCFCSFNCAAAYNLKMEDAYVWNRYGLLKKLYNDIYNTNEEFTIAPPREVFQKFGGPLSHDDYRKNCKKCNKEYRFIMPPMTSIVPLIEEGQADKTKVNISLADLNKKMSIKRTKPLPNVRSTLFETLGIKENKK
ncbi:putative transcription factor [Fadolivirus algeromassiliense]|jgi:hypothetical protein|uniref:Transcription factor n=1 Tax=Fadolivirus FV1/VV64 TaxID=3070911 RepID=A0A7D3QU84_9VIRU|nr:putative transcription factor [Fadolivirus algeromassiliense]QKF93947.1 putative transcription factor [Fadolivirus FV1/VV64]